MSPADLVLYPWVNEFCLVNVVASDPIQPISETMENTNVNNIWHYIYELGYTKFTAIRDGCQINIKLNHWFSKTWISFEFQTYLSGPIAISNNKLYILELDVNNAS